MNRSQRIVVISVGLAVIATLLFPPHTIEWRDAQFNMGYAPLFSPPAMGVRPANVDVRLLLIQWAGIVFAGACVWLFFSGENRGGLEERRSSLDVSTARELSLSSQAWRRLWATNIDFFLILVGINVTLLAMGWGWPGQIVEATLVATLSTVAIAASAQAILLSMFATTLGKTLMGIKVLDAAGKKLSWWAAFKRSLNVLTGGCGLFLLFPLLQIPLFWMHFNILKREGILSWDREPGGNYQVAFVPSSKIRPIIGAAVCIASILAVSFSSGLMRYKPTMHEMTVQDMQYCIQEGILTDDQCLLAFLESD